MDDPKRPPRCQHEPEDENVWAKSLVERIADSAENAEDQPPEREDQPDPTKKPASE